MKKSMRNKNLQQIKFYYPISHVRCKTQKHWMKKNSSGPLSTVIFETLMGSILRKSVEFATLILLQKKGFYFLVDQVPKYYGANAKLPKNGSKRGKYSYFNTFFDYLLLLL